MHHNIAVKSFTVINILKGIILFIILNGMHYKTGYIILEEAVKKFNMSRSGDAEETIKKWCQYSKDRHRKKNISTNM